MCGGGFAVPVCAATVQDFLERYEVGETVGVGGEHCIASMQAGVAHPPGAQQLCVRVLPLPPLPATALYPLCRALCRICCGQAGQGQADWRASGNQGVSVNVHPA